VHPPMKLNVAVTSCMLVATTWLCAQCTFNCH